VDRQSQVDFILEHYENPRYRGPLPGASVVQRGSNPGCGDVVTFYLSIEPNDRVAAISFEGEGCTISLAASSMVAEMFAGKTLREVEETPADAVLSMIGPEIAGTRLRCATLGLNTVKEAIKAVRRDFRDSDDV
jgi:nitrogen fixation protein NifU and related proteins